MFLGFPGGLDGKETALYMGELGLIPVLGRSPGGGHDNPFQYLNCLEFSHVPLFGTYFSDSLCLILYFCCVRSVMADSLQPHGL